MSCSCRCIPEAQSSLRCVHWPCRSAGSVIQKRKSKLTELSPYSIRLHTGDGWLHDAVDAFCRRPQPAACTEAQVPRCLYDTPKGACRRTTRSERDQLITPFTHEMIIGQQHLRAVTGADRDVATPASTVTQPKVSPISMTSPGLMDLSAIRVKPAMKFGTQCAAGRVQCPDPPRR